MRKTMKKLTANETPVDAGMILVTDISYLNDHLRRINAKENLKRLGNTFKVANGLYKIHWKIKETWNGKIEGDEEIEVTGGEIAVVDPCYVIGTDTYENWISWLEYNRDRDDREYNIRIKKTGKYNKGFIIDEMGGDGTYKVELELTKIRKE